MLWIVVDVVVAVLCVALLVVVALRLWRQVKALGTSVSAAAERLDEVSAQVSSIGQPGPSTAAGRAQAPAGGPGVRSTRSS